MASIRVLHIGDVSGSSGMGALFLSLKSIIKEEKVDFVIVNGENASSGFGISESDYRSFINMGVDVITSGNHIWQKEEIFQILEKEDNILRPYNYPPGTIGKGYVIKNGIAVINAEGRYSMTPIDCPFQTVGALVEKIRKITPLIFVDFHAEHTDEKEALAFFLDGKVTSVAGTHTHVQTMDEKILPNGTAYITDLGLTGVQDSVIGSREDKAIERSLTQLPIKSEVKEGRAKIQGIIVEADKDTGKALSVKRFSR